jgi:hypothetical protein
MVVLLLYTLYALGGMGAFQQVPEEGNAQSPAEGATVWIFLDPECPISQVYTLTLRTLYQQYAPQGIGFTAVYDSPTSNRQTIRRFHQKYKLPFAGRKDRNYALARRWNATITPEIIFASASGEVLYRGAIDNWYYALGKNRPAPTEHYLKNALDAWLGKYPIVTRRTEPIGCLMNR